MSSIAFRLEEYTKTYPEFVLIVNLETEDGEGDLIMVYKGFSSSLMRPTAFDPDVPAIDDRSTIKTIDRLLSPYNPDNPQYIDRDLSLQEMETILSEAHI